MLEDHLTSSDVRVDGSGKTDLITLSGKSEIHYRGNSPVIFDATSLEAEGKFEVSAKQDGKKRTFISGKISAVPSDRQKVHCYVKPVLSEPSLEVIISGSQDRTLVVDNPADYYLIPVSVIKRVLRETSDFVGTQPEAAPLPGQPFKGFKGHLKKLADREHVRRSNVSLMSVFPTVGAFYRELGAPNPADSESSYRFQQQSEEMARHIFPYWDSSKDFVILDSIGPIINFRTLKRGTLKLEGKVSMKLPHGFIINGAEYESGRISGKGAVTLQGGIDKLSLTSPLSVESDFARITGELDLIRSDGIAKNWPTSVQISPASLWMTAKARTMPNPKYWVAPAGLCLAGSMPICYVATIIGMLTHSITNLEVEYSVMALLSSPLIAAVSNTLRVTQERTIIRDANIQSRYTGKLYTGNIKLSREILS